jgi:ABC-type multidrug transport system permease subunit
MSFLMDVHSVLWADLKVLRRRIFRTVASSLTYPILFLLAFGYGLGRGVTFEGHSYLDFVIPGIIALTSMTSSYNGAGSKLHVDRLYYRCFDELLMAPISTSAIVVGKALTGVIHGLISSLAMTAASLLISAKFRASPQLPLFLLLLLISCFVFAFLGVLAALIVKSHQDMGAFSTFVMVPMSFLSGTFFSLESVPELVRIALYLSPLTHSSQCLRATALGQPLPWLSTTILLSFGVLFFAACIWRLRNLSV